MTFLLDTNVVSEPKKPQPSPSVVKWLRRMPVESGFVSVVTLGEIRRGIEPLRSEPASRSRLVDLETWHGELSQGLYLHVVPVDVRVADRWGRLAAELRGHEVDAADALIAATALVHDWTVATRNVRHFERTGVRVVNPFEA